MVTGSLMAVRLPNVWGWLPVLGGWPTCGGFRVAEYSNRPQRPVGQSRRRKVIAPDWPLGGEVSRRSDEDAPRVDGWLLDHRCSRNIQSTDCPGCLPYWTYLSMRYGRMIWYWVQVNYIRGIPLV